MSNLWPELKCKADDGYQITSNDFSRAIELTMIDSDATLCKITVHTNSFVCFLYIKHTLSWTSDNRLLKRASTIWAKVCTQQGPKTTDSGPTSQHVFKRSKMRSFCCKGVGWNKLGIRRTTEARKHLLRLVKRTIKTVFKSFEWWWLECEGKKKRK